MDANEFVSHFSSIKLHVSHKWFLFIYIYYTSPFLICSYCRNVFIGICKFLLYSLACKWHILFLFYAHPHPIYFYFIIVIFATFMIVRRLAFDILYLYIEMCSGWLNSIAGIMKKRFTSYVKLHLGANNTGGSRSSSPNRNLLTGGSAKVSRFTSHPQRITASDYDDVSKCSQDSSRNFTSDTR